MCAYARAHTSKSASANATNACVLFMYYITFLIYYLIKYIYARTNERVYK